MIRKFAILGAGIAVLALAACSGARATPAPFPASAPWYNVSRPLTWSALKGRAVLLDFFTPGCINCVHMVPVEETLARRFGKRLVIIGVDSPKFTDSGTRSGLTDFITMHHIRHPVVLDAHQRIWNAWNAVAWPTFVLVGPKGKTQGRFIGEKSVADLAGPIKQALAKAPPAKKLKSLPLAPMAMAGGALDSPGGIAVGKTRVAVSDTGHNRIVLASRDGKVKAVIGGCDGDFERPHGLTFHDGKLYVADTLGQRIRVINLKTHKVTTLAGSGKRAFVASGEFSAKNADLNSPWDVQWAGGKLYISMAGDHDIWRYDPKTKRLGPWAGNGREGLNDGGRRNAEFAQPSGLDAHAGTLYDADPESSAIRAVKLPKGHVRTLIGQGLFKFGEHNGKAGEALLQHAQGLAWLDGSLYIADTFNDALRRLNLASDQVSTVAKHLEHPQAVAAPAPGTLLVVEEGGNRIEAVAPKTGQTKPWPLKGLKAPPSCSAK
jgi:thiol-disulfide isomerase/thioredoxin